MLTVINMNQASPKSAGDNTIDMLEIMTRAFDESEGGQGVIACVDPSFYFGSYESKLGGYCFRYELRESGYVMVICGIGTYCFPHANGGHCQSHECNGDGIYYPY